ncbi:MAG: 16S rRNA (adenine(1518)-N(6)/adenine(1519)-N(6))-dimethyltransferase RsmA [Clostridiaceae bacterium]|jgi:16S rRNA (adenine1518-N6/adenine1519-N6)-dimethyltransferase|nr:16S rRNA (adenine(1518)-N(6)/adenine(1519)-N(6))-dimethyltransferase RsmA [Clostridiaceae bacterium]
MIQDVRNILKKLQLRPTKSLGQNFLADEGILRKIGQAAEIDSNDVILEIGPGLGSLTAVLAESAGCVVAVEIDKRLIPVLHSNMIGYRNVVILNDDILKIDVHKELKPYMKNEDGTERRLKIVANLPYYITTPVIMKLLESSVEAECMVFMVQKEVADRMAAAPGGKDYGALSVAVQYYSRPTVVMQVHPHSFVPQPDVESSVVRLELHKTPPVELLDKDLFFKVVKAAFGQRRKTLVNALNNASYLGLDKERITELLEKTGIEKNQRGETLSIEQFAQLSNLIYEQRRRSLPG